MSKSSTVFCLQIWKHSVYILIAQCVYCDIVCPIMNHQIALQRILYKKLDEARARNASYSLRAFSRKIGLSPATLSLVLSGQRGLSEKLAQKVADKLLLDPKERADLLRKFPTKKANAKDAVDPAYLQLTSDQYQVVADWKAYAILSLVRLTDFKNDPEWIASRLGTSKADVEKILERLLRLGLLQKTKEGSLQRESSDYRTSDGILNLSLRRSHYQTLELAQKMLDSGDLEHTDSSWITFHVSKKTVSKAKTLIRKFQNDLVDILQDAEAPDEVYRLAVYLMPLTQIQNHSLKRSQ